MSLAKPPARSKKVAVDEDSLVNFVIVAHPQTYLAGHVSYSTIDSQHGRTVADLKDADAKDVPHFRLYDLRHTFLTRLGEAGADPFTIQKIAGHASILVSQRYVHPTPERLEDAFAKLECTT
jgi:integrase